MVPAQVDEVADRIALVLPVTRSLGQHKKTVTCSNLGVDEPKTPFSQNKFSSSILMTEALFFSMPIPSLCKLLETVSKVFVRSRNLRSPLSSMENGALLLCVGLYLAHSPNYECFLEDNVPHPLVVHVSNTNKEIHLHTSSGS